MAIRGKAARDLVNHLGLEMPKPSKYRSIITPVLWRGRLVKFHSRKEARRAQELLLLEKAGLITGLERQVAYHLDVNGTPIAAYVADFRYREEGTLIVEDVKSAATRRLEAYRIKKRLLLALHGITIRET